MIWDQLTSNQIDQLDKNVSVILPIAAIEQHGPHLPLATDRLIGEHFAHALDEMIPDRVLILPAVSIGCSDHHMSFSGSLSLSHSSFSKQVEDIVRSVVHHGFHKIILMNSHGGNQGIGRVLVEKLGYRNSEIDIVLATWWRLAPEQLKKISDTGLGGTGHAGEFETSLMMHIAPHLVRKEEIKSKSNTPTISWAEGDLLQGPKADYYRSINQRSENGVIGDPSAAKAEKGEKITRVIVEILKQIVLDLSG